MQEGKQPLWAGVQLFARLTLNAGEDAANQPARLAHLDDGNDRAILVQGNEGPAQIVRLGHRGTPSIDVKRRNCHLLAARPIASLSWREMDSNFQYASTVRWHRARICRCLLPRSGAPRGARLPWRDRVRGVP